jgi:NADH-quinone oxidoreductase subunit N
MYFGEEGSTLETGRSVVQWAFLMGSAAVMVIGIVNMFGVEAMAQAAAATLVR